MNNDKVLIISVAGGLIGAAPLFFILLKDVIEFPRTLGFSYFLSMLPYVVLLFLSTSVVVYVSLNIFGWALT